MDYAKAHKLKMMKSLFLSLFLLALVPFVKSQPDSLRVLFLGNSYTAYNNLPALTQSLSASANKTLIVDSNTPGGHTLEGHAGNPGSQSKIKQGNWDFVVLQEQSQIPTIDYYRINSMYPGARQLRDSIRKYNPCARVVMYMSWGRRYGGQQCDGNGVHCSPVFTDFSHMQDSLASAYLQIGREIDAYVAPVGMAWKQVIEDTSVVLHTGDNSHPNYSGSYLAACVFHSVFWKESPRGLAFSGSLDAALATYLQEAADSTVFHGTTDWNLEVDKVTARFSFQLFGDSVQFTNLSQSLAPTRYHWDFGDGATSQDPNPSHIYQANQTYIVSLIVSNCRRADTLTDTVSLNSLGLSAADLGTSISLSPNPFTDVLSLSLAQPIPGLQVRMVNPAGKLIEAFELGHAQSRLFDFSLLPKGLYFLIFWDRRKQERAVFKLMKN
jgi:hypothetical protein